MKNKNKKSTIISITCLFLVMLLLVGLTYAYYRTRVIGNQSTSPSVSVTSKKMEITYEDGTASMSMTGKIEPGFTASKTFYVKNTGSEIVKYSVIIDEMNNEFTRNQDWLVTLTKNGEEVISETDNVYLAVGTHQVLLGSESISAPTDDVESKDTYVLTVTYKNLTDINQSEDMGMNLSFRVNIAEEQYTWKDAPQGSLLYSLKANQPSGSEETTPGQVASPANEKRILETEDDYGKSYVYRGNVENNYVTYSNMCWRIVRVQGDGTIKLALADWEHPCGTANGYSATYTDSAFVADASGNAMYIAYKASAAWDATDFPFANSYIPLVLSTWAENKNLDMSQLVEAEWCNDTAHTGNNYYDDDWNPVPEGSSSINPYYTKKTYGAYGRLLPVDSAEPSLKCNTKGLNNTKAIRYKNVLGILSADEVAFAGSTNWYGGGTWDYYLKTNTAGNYYWTLSPSYLVIDDEEEVSSHVWGVDGVVDLFGDDWSDSTGAVRPSVVLRSDVTIQDGGDGTIDAPYVIN